jgi:integrase
VYFRADGNPRWIVRFRYQGKDYLPQEQYPVDLDETNRASKFHVLTARGFAEARALQARNALLQTGKPITQVASSWSLRALLTKALNEWEVAREARKTTPDIKVHKSVRTDISNLRVLLGLSQTSKNKDAIKGILDKRLTELKKDDFLSDTNAKALNQVWVDRDGARAGNSSVRKVLKTLVMVFKRAKDEWGIDVETPIPSLKGLPANDGRERVLTAKEWNDIMDELRKGKAEGATVDCIEFARLTAVRRSEANKLDWRDINFNDRTAHLRDTKGKNGQPNQRTIPLNDEAIQILERRKAEHWKPDSAVFALKVDGQWKRLHIDTITQAWNRARKRVAKKTGNADILTARVHDLRHTRITEWGGVLSPAEAAKLSGHKDLRMFMRYFNPDPKAIGKKLDALEKGRNVGPGNMDDVVNALLGMSIEDATAAFTRSMQLRTMQTR